MRKREGWREDRHRCDAIEEEREKEMRIRNTPTHENILGRKRLEHGLSRTGDDVEVLEEGNTTHGYSTRATKSLASVSLSSLEAKFLNEVYADEIEFDDEAIVFNEFLKTLFDRDEDEDEEDVDYVAGEEEQREAYAEADEELAALVKRRLVPREGALHGRGKDDDHHRDDDHQGRPEEMEDLLDDDDDDDDDDDNDDDDGITERGVEREELVEDAGGADDDEEQNVFRSFLQTLFDPDEDERYVDDAGVQRDNKRKQREGDECEYDVARNDGPAQMPSVDAENSRRDARCAGEDQDGHIEVSERFRYYDRAKRDAESARSSLHTAAYEMLYGEHPARMRRARDEETMREEQWQEVRESLWLQCAILTQLTKQLQRLVVTAGNPGDVDGPQSGTGDIPADTDAQMRIAADAVSRLRFLSRARDIGVRAAPILGSVRIDDAVLTRELRNVHGRQVTRSASGCEDSAPSSRKKTASRSQPPRDYSEVLESLRANTWLFGSYESIWDNPVSLDTDVQDTHELDVLRPRWQKRKKKDFSRGEDLLIMMARPLHFPSDVAGLQKYYFPTRSVLEIKERIKVWHTHERWKWK